MSVPRLPRADGLRVLRIVTFGNSVAIIVLTVLMVGAFLANQKRGNEIQDSRVQSILTSCRESNDRNRRTITTLDRLLAARIRTATPEQARRLRASRASTVLLIQALAPRRDCAARVRQLTP